MPSGGVQAQHDRVTVFPNSQGAVQLKTLSNEGFSLLVIQRLQRKCGFSEGQGQNNKQKDTKPGVRKLTSETKRVNQIQKTDLPNQSKNWRKSLLTQKRQAIATTQMI